MGRTVFAALQRAPKAQFSTENNSVEGLFIVCEYGTVTNKTIFLFGGWGFGPSAYTPLIHFFVKLGLHCVLFIPRAALISEHVPFSLSVAASKSALTEVRANIKANPSAEFTVLGLSFGSLFAMKVARECRQVKKAILIAPFGDFSRHAELWQQNRYFRKVWSSQPTTVEDSAALLSSIGTTEQMHKLRGKEMLVFYSQDDEVMHGHVVADFVKSLRRQHVAVEVREIGGSHIGGIVKTAFLHKKTMQSFLERNSP
ncbi:MAG TPA: hypothetical protein VFT87_04370 [Candidatus Saccharimonadales bacterium]|nr:hypothetical protein [Candidatus Saccharimonadales bacterium]